MDVSACGRPADAFISFFCVLLRVVCAIFFARGILQRDSPERTCFPFKNGDSMERKGYGARPHVIAWYRSNLEARGGLICILAINLTIRGFRCFQRALMMFFSKTGNIHLTVHTRKPAFIVAKLISLVLLPFSLYTTEESPRMYKTLLYFPRKVPFMSISAVINPICTYKSRKRRTHRISFIDRHLFQKREVAYFLSLSPPRKSPPTCFLCVHTLAPTRTNTLDSGR